MTMHSKSMRELEANVAAGNDQDYESDPRFNSIFGIIDQDSNGTLDKREAYKLVTMYDAQKGKNARLKQYLATVIGVTTLIIVLLTGATFGATFVAVAANKETSVSSSGALMSKDGSRELSTVSKAGHQIGAIRNSDNESLCLHMVEFEAMKAGALSGEKVVVDIETLESGAHQVMVIDSQGAYITENRTCYNVDDPQKIFCLSKAQCATEAHRKLWESRGLSVQRELNPGHDVTVAHEHPSWHPDPTVAMEVCSDGCDHERWAGGCGNNCYPCKQGC